MDSKKSAQIKNKKRKIIIILCIIAVIIMLVIGFFAGTLIYTIMQDNNELKVGNVNTLYINEKVNSKEDENILTVELDGENQINEVDETNNKNMNTNNNTDVKPKTVDAPYYIKVNYESNVVTIYKKDSKR